MGIRPPAAPSLGSADLRGAHSIPRQVPSSACRPAKRLEVAIGDKTLSLSNLDKVLYPRAGFTKGQVIDYYTRIAPVAAAAPARPAAHAEALSQRRRGQVLLREALPVARARVGADRGRSGPGRNEGNITSASARTCRRSSGWPTWPTSSCTRRWRARPRWTHPTIVAFDLDPGPPATIVECARVALELRRAFDFWDLQAFPKTSGSKGMQVYLPLNTPATYEETRAFSSGLAQLLERRDPDLVVSEMTKAKRGGQGVRGLEPERRASRRRSTSTRCGRWSGRRSRRR